MNIVKGEGLLLSTLRTSMTTRKLIAVHTAEAEHQRFSLGFVHALTEEAYVLVTVDEYGRTDEIQAGLVEHIWMASTGGAYEEAILKQHPSIWDVQVPESISDVESLLKYAKQNQEVVSLAHSNDVLYSGLFVDSDEEFLTLDAYSSSGESEGRLLVRWSDIVRAAFRGPDHQALSKTLESS